MIDGGRDWDESKGESLELVRLLVYCLTTFTC